MISSLDVICIAVMADLACRFNLNADISVLQEQDFPNNMQRARQS